MIVESVVYYHVAHSVELVRPHERVSLSTSNKNQSTLKLNRHVKNRNVKTYVEKKKFKAYADFIIYYNLSKHNLTKFN